MGAAAVAAYVRTLADLQRIRVAEVADAAQVQPKYLWRMEHGEVLEPAARILRAMCAAVNGYWDDVGELLESEEASPEDGRVRALAWAVRRNLLTSGDRRILETASPEEIRAAAAYLRRLADDR